MFPLSKLGMVLEEGLLRLNRHGPVITVSESTRNELIVRGYDVNKIKIIHNGVYFRPWELAKWFIKEENGSKLTGQ